MEGISQAEMLAFLFDAAHEREKFAKRASHRLSKDNEPLGEHVCPHMAIICEREQFTKRVSHRCANDAQRTLCSGDIEFTYIILKNMINQNKLII